MNPKPRYIAAVLLYQMQNYLRFLGFLIFTLVLTTIGLSSHLQRCLLSMLQLTIRPMFFWCHGLWKSRRKNVHDCLKRALPLLSFHSFGTESPTVTCYNLFPHDSFFVYKTYGADLPSITCCNMFPVTPLLYINICSSSCISWFHPKSTVFNVFSMYYHICI
jgi:hypothetical protein